MERLGSRAVEYDVDGMIQHGAEVGPDGEYRWPDEYENEGEFAHLMWLYELEPVIEARMEWESHGEGYYEIGFSDGGEDWTNNGPVWFDILMDLQREVRFAVLDAATDTHVPWVQYVGDTVEG